MNELKEVFIDGIRRYPTNGGEVMVIDLNDYLGNNDYLMAEDDASDEVTDAYIKRHDCVVSEVNTLRRFDDTDMAARALMGYMRMKSDNVEELVKTSKAYGFEDIVKHYGYMEMRPNRRFISKVLYKTKQISLDVIAKMEQFVPEVVVITVSPEEEDVLLKVVSKLNKVYKKLFGTFKPSMYIGGHIADCYGMAVAVYNPKPIGVTAFGNWLFPFLQELAQAVPVDCTTVNPLYPIIKYMQKFERTIFDQSCVNEVYCAVDDLEEHIIQLHLRSATSVKYWTTMDNYIAWLDKFHFDSFLKSSKITAPEGQILLPDLSKIFADTLKCYKKDHENWTYPFWCDLKDMYELLKKVDAQAGKFTMYNMNP